MSRYSKTKEPTIRQKTTFNALLLAIQSGEPFTWRAIMKKGGYGATTSRMPEYNLLNREGFQTLLSRIDDAPILAKVYEIIFGDDKRSSLTAADMIMKLKDRYPAQKSKIIGLFDTIKNLEEDENTI